MSHFLDRLNLLLRSSSETLRRRPRRDAPARTAPGRTPTASAGSTTRSCAPRTASTAPARARWKIYVKGGIVTWETQQTDYPRTRPDMPNHEPRGCSRGASATAGTCTAPTASSTRWCAARLLQQLARGAPAPRPGRGLGRRSSRTTPSARDYQQRARPGRLRALELGRGRTRSSPRPTSTPSRSTARTASSASRRSRRCRWCRYAAGSRYLSLIGGVCMSFYDWYCDLPPASPQIWGEQTDVPESADWYNSTFIIAWGSNVPQTRTPDAHFFTEVRYKGTKIVAVTPDYSEVAKLGRPVAAPQAGHRRRARDGDGPRDPEGVPLRRGRPQRLLRRLRAPLHRPADAGACWWSTAADGS